jgi:predicted nucleic acid-binding protein
MTTGANLARFVIDTSVAAKWYLTDEVLVAEAELVLRLYFTYHQIELIAPAFFAYELPNVLRQAVSRGRITMAEADQHLTDFLALDLPVVTDAHLIETAARLSFRHLVHTYDLLFAELARTEGIPLITADERFARAVAPLGYDLLLLSAPDLRLRLPAPPT